MSLVPAKPLVQTQVCTNSLQVGTSTNGRDDHRDQISARRSLWARFGTTNEIIAIEYQTFGGREFIQFISAFKTSLFPYHGSVFNALKLATSVTKTSQGALPSVLREIKVDTPIIAGACSK